MSYLSSGLLVRSPLSRRRRSRLTSLVTAGLLLATLLAGGAAAPASAAGAQAAPGTTAGPRLSWAPPVLSSPVTIQVSASRNNLSLDPARDYVLQMPSTPVTVAGGLTVVGGRNVVLVGGEIRIPAGVAADGRANRGLYLKQQTGTVHVEGLLISGAGLGEGIDLDQRLGAVVQLQNVRVEHLAGTREGHHADVLQTWAGPRVLRVDGLSGSSDYQGMFLLPQQFGTQAQPEVFDLRRVDLRGSSVSGYMLWRDSLAWPLTVSDVWVSPRNPDSRDSFLWPKGSGAGTSAWPSVNVGTPAQGSFVPAGRAGTGYTSPGYASSPVPPAVFRDAPRNHPFFAEISWLARSGIATGYGDGSFGPTRPVSRAAMAAFLFRSAGVEGYVPPRTKRFTDVPTTHPFYTELSWLAESGITTGYPDGSFRPDGRVTREAMAAFLYRLADARPVPASARFSDVAVGSRFFTEVSWLAREGITTGYRDGSFGSARPIARDAMAAFLYRYSARNS